jgi:hypothetical protein
MFKIVLADAATGHVHAEERFANADQLAEALQTIGRKAEDLVPDEDRSTLTKRLQQEWSELE